MAKQKLRASELKGLFINQDPKKGTVYYDILSRRAFILTSSDVPTYMLYTSMLPVCILVAFLFMSLFRLDYIYGLIIFLVSYLIAMILFRIFFFYKLIEVENYTPENKGNIVSFLAENYSTKRLLILTLLLVLLTVVIPLNVQLQKMEGINKYGSYVACAITGIGTILSILAMLKQKNDQK